MFSEEVLKKYESQSTGTLPIHLNSDESMFSDMRDCNFSAVGNFLSTRAKNIAALYDVSLVVLYEVDPIIKTIITSLVSPRCQDCSSVEDVCGQVASHARAETELE